MEFRKYYDKFGSGPGSLSKSLEKVNLIFFVLTSKIYFASRSRNDDITRQI